ncbi:MAG: hypothetical protein HUU50_06800 [Candidatus Brocadiae bacterium]|nr:hypothetical protein [Candidatus Brocadiia bacterium]
MIRLEIKVIVPDNKKREDFLKLLLDTANADPDSFFWQTPFDIVDTERATLEAVLGQEGFPFLEGTKLLTITCDFASKKQAKKAYTFFKGLSLSWEMEINGFTGRRLYSDLLDVNDFT